MCGCIHGEVNRNTSNLSKSRHSCEYYTFSTGVRTEWEAPHEERPYEAVPVAQLQRRVPVAKTTIGGAGIKDAPPKVRA